MKFFGGALLLNKRKSQRPLTAKDSIRFVRRSEWAIGRHSFLVSRNRTAICRILDHFAKKFGVRIYQRSLNSNHIHLLLKITNRTLYKAFIKSISGQIASHVMEQQSFKLFHKKKNFRQNVLEALGFIPYKVRKNDYTVWLAKVSPVII